MKFESKYRINKIILNNFKKTLDNIKWVWYYIVNDKTKRKFERKIKMTVEEIKLELENAEKFLEKIEKESESEDICAIYAMELGREIEEMYDYIESLEKDLYNKENLIEYSIMNW